MPFTVTGNCHIPVADILLIFEQTIYRYKEHFKNSFIRTQQMLSSSRCCSKMKEAYKILHSMYQDI